MVETGSADGAAGDDGRRVAAFCGEVTLAPGAEATIVIVFGQAPSRAEALAAASRAAVVQAEADLAATRAAWADRLGKVEVRTNRPDFDRLVNTWLPYQLYASRLWGRVGPNQRGRRHRLSRSVAGRAAADPARTAPRARADRAAREPAVSRGRRAQVVASRPERRHGPRPAHQGERPASVAALRARALRSPARGRGSSSTSSTPFLEGEAVPEHEDTWIVIPRVSRETATVYQHARLAIDFTLRYLGKNGLPLLRAGDWNDGIDALGRRGIGTSVWMGFFLANVLDGSSRSRD